MQLKLEESPRQWQKFTAVMLFALMLVTALLTWRGKLSNATALYIFCGCALVMLLAWIYPRAFRGFYRGGMRASFAIGQCMGAIMLTLFYLFILTPTGWLLKLFGKELLERRSRKTSYWQSIPEERQRISRLDKQF